MIEVVYSREAPTGDELRCCVIAIAPDAGEQQELAEKYEIAPDLIAHCLDENERSRTMRSGNSALVILRVPRRLGPHAEIPYVTTPLGLIVADHTLAVVTTHDTPVAEGLRESAKNAKAPLGRHHVILEALELTAETFLHDLNAINDAVDRLEDRLRASLQNREVLVLLRYQKALVFFTVALRSLDHLLEHLRQTPTFQVPDEDRALFGDISTEIKQALEVATVSRDILSEMMDAFASIISNNLNIVMKFLAALTIIVTLPMIVATFYGMNVALPFETNPSAFWILLGISALFSLGAFLAFRLKRWL